MDVARREPRRPPLVWRLGVGAVLGFLRGVLGWRTRPQRPKLVPRRGAPLIVVFNHTSNVDAFIVADAVRRQLGHWCRPLVKAELLEVAVLGGLLKSVGAIPVRRAEEGGRETAYDAAAAQLRAGGTILIAPEGTTTHDGSLLPLRHGAARLALASDVDVLVVTQFGAQRGFSPVVRVPERNVVVTLSMDLITPRTGEDAASLTGRVAATMIDRSAELLATYPQPDPTARWWPPYAQPASPTATARHNLARYRHNMGEAVAHARQRMSELAEEYEAAEHLAQARERALAVAGEVSARTEQLADQARHRVDELAAQTRERATTWSRHLSDESDPSPGTEETDDAAEVAGEGPSADEPAEEADAVHRPDSPQRGDR